MKYRKKPVVIEAIQFNGENQDDVAEFMGEMIRTNFFPDILIETLEGTMKANIGDYIIKGVKGEFYPCKPDIFEMTYEPVNCYMEELQSVYNQITNILKENNVLMNITSPRPYLIKKDDDERINAEAEDLLKEDKLEEYFSKMEEKEAYRFYFDEAYKYE
jgi:hypothetical protein